MAFRATPEQDAAIHAKGTVLVSAAAGSGKTAVLTERVISRLLDDENPIDADRLLIVTFTNAAAAEMKSRIEKRLAEEKAKDPGNIRIHEQLLLMSGASITTIDSFCIALIRENFDRLGLPPDFKVATEETVGPLSDRVLSEILEEAFRADQAGMFDLMEALGDEYGDGRLRDMILQIYDSSSSMPFPKKWRNVCVAQYTDGVAAGSLANTVWGRYIFSEIRSAAQPILENVDVALQYAQSEPYLDRTFSPALQAMRQLSLTLDTAAQAGAWDDAYHAVRQMIIPAAKEPSVKEGMTKPAGFDAFKHHRFSPIKRFTDGLIQLVCDRLTANEAVQLDLIGRLMPVVERIVRLTDLYDERLLAGLLAKGMLTFSYIERFALSLFVDEDGRPREGAETLQNRFDEVLVDEYQDTNKLQDTLFAAISGGENLFMVGDVKQSIYRFRHADPDGFLEKKNRFAPYETAGQDEPRKIILGKNFRSRKSVCDFVNFCFENWMSEKSAGMTYGDEDKLIPGAQFPENGGEDVQAVLLSYDGKANSRAEAEALYIAEYIQNIMRAGAVVRDETDRDKLRCARYSDFAILMRSLAGKADVYCDTLRRCGIPVTAQSGDFFDSVEITTFLSLIKTIANPTRDIPLMSVLLTPIFGFTPDEVARLRLNDREVGLYSSVCTAAEGGHEKAAALIAKLKFYREKAASMPIDRFLLYLLEDTGYLDCATAMQDGNMRRDHLLMLVDLATTISEGGTVSLSEFTARVDRLAKAGGFKTPSAVSGTDSVRIMTMHASKGLQFPICILANLAAPMNRSDSKGNLLISEEMGLGLQFHDDQAAMRLSALSRDAIALSAAKATVAEELRLIYVALTRAEEKLLLLFSDTHDFEKKLAAAEEELILDDDEWRIDPTSVLGASSYSKWFYLLFSAHPQWRGALESGEADLGGVRLITAQPKQPEQMQTVRAGSAPDEALVESLRERFVYRYPYAALNRIIAKTGASRLAEDLSDADYSFTAVPAFMSESGLTPAERGTAAHKFLQYAQFADGVDVSAELERLVCAGTLSKQEADAIDQKRMRRFFESDVFARILRSPRLMREVRFLDEIPASYFDPDLPEEVAGEAVIVQGIADCIFEEDGGLVILDYKTDRVTDMQTLAGRYSRQLKIYAAVCEKTYGMPVKECILYSLRLGESVQV